jgi:quinol-cytochrome oxidoreductase complex cytochrome b subunit
MKSINFLCYLLFLPGAFAETNTNERDKQQQPLTGSSPQRQLDKHSYWRLNFSSGASHYFASVYGLLQQWPNTFFPNGHLLAPGEIQPYTNLYHERWGNEPPPSPEWLAFDM